MAIKPKWAAFALMHYLCGINESEKDAIALFSELVEAPDQFFEINKDILIWEPFAEWTPDMIAEYVENMAYGMQNVEERQ